jgi:3-deoxy-D-manno-octulosonic-acid transferase
MQGNRDAQRIESLGSPATKIAVTGNIKFDVKATESEKAITDLLAKRFGLPGERPLIIAASTHEPEELTLLEAWCSVANDAVPVRPRLMIAPRHPERFDAVAEQIETFRNDPACEWREYTFARRSLSDTGADADADVILLDTIGELRAAYPLAEIVFVGGSLIPHGGQSVLEPAAAGKAIITGPHTHNFADAISVFRNNNALIQLPETTVAADEIFTTLCDLLENGELRGELGRNARAVMTANSGATGNTIVGLKELLKAGRSR